jgi:tRNA (adenine37-N6)-methyltransferase
MDITYREIGVIHSPFTEKKGMPVQPAGAAGIRGTVRVHDEFKSGLKDLSGFSHIILLYHFNQSQGFDLQVVPFLDTVQRGVFATRAPRRPNQIGLSLVRLVGVDGNILEVEGIDVLDGTPLLDIKPHVPQFAHTESIRTGWLEGSDEDVESRRSDERFR